MNKIPENWLILKWNFRCLCHLVMFLVNFNKLISIYARNLQLLFHSVLFKSLVTNYLNEIGIDLVIFGLLSDLGETFINFYRFFYQFSRKVAFLVFCGGNHQKCLNFLFCAWNLYCSIIVFEIKNPSVSSGDPAKNQYDTPYPCTKSIRM